MHKLLLILHIGFAIFTLGPLIAVLMATPRRIREGDAVVLRFLHRTTNFYGLGSLGVLLFGLLLAKGHFDQAWLSASMTLFLVALVLLLLIARDQGAAIKKIDVALATLPKPAETAETADSAAAEGDEPERPALPANLAQVERGRISALAGVIGLIWIVILILMVVR